MRARGLLIIAAAGEFATGAALLLVPSSTIRLLLGEELAAPVPVVVARITGAALVAIGTICWLAKDDATSRGRPDVLVGLLTYNLAVATILIHAATAYGLHGIALWTVVLLHLLLALWCIGCLRSGGLLARSAGSERR